MQDYARLEHEREKMQAVPRDNRRDFVDVMWQIAEKRSCDEVVIRYDCGHHMKAEVLVPVLPKTREYSNQEADRRRFMQHSLFVLTKNPGSPKVQITVPEGRCRLCGRGQRQVLFCGLLQRDLTEDRQRRDQLADLRGKALVGGALASQACLFAQARRLELPLSSHVFLQAMGQVCRLPDNITPPPLLQNSSALQTSALKPFDGPPLPREGLHQWSRKEIEDELKAEVVKYVGGATFLLVFVVIECLYLCVVRFGPSSHGGLGDDASTNASRTLSGELRNLTSVSAIEMGIANSTWALSALTLTVHKAFGPMKDSSGGMTTSLWWTAFVHPLWVVTSVLLAPLLWVLDLVVALPRFLLLHVVLAVARSLVWRPCSWLLGFLMEFSSAFAAFVVRCLFSRPTAMLTQIPVTNPMVVAMVLSLLVAALSAPQPPSLPLPGIWTDLLSLAFTRGIRRAVFRSRTLGPLVQRLRAFWASRRKDGRSKGGVRGIPVPRGQKDGPERPGKPQLGKQGEGRVPSTASQPACFLCLDRPSRYILEPCGHQVVCGECAVQLVEATVQLVNKESAGAHYSSDKNGGGACPSCGQAITRAMRVFS
eukprot:TRINITY_DN42769_c0_g1_i1.p1 TRINITY_DN42769_c0_g1~~TRINITY_DN42769_c0_g1_i1.p1  ORF type:complete len:607 (-),score=85.67 TRINITY_DN42769_c0_g1_i1:51-1832(-)